MDKQQVIDYLDKLSSYELVGLISEVEQKTGISAAVAVAPQQQQQQQVEPEPEQEEFDVKLVGFGSSKMPVIKVVRAMTGLGLKESKELVESLGTVRTAVGKEEAEAAKKAIEEAGGTAEIK